jgi:hypothetical protein
MTHLNEMLRPEIRPEVDNLPRSQANQHAHCTKCEPLDPLVCALICISQLLLASTEVVHLGYYLPNDFLDSTELYFDRFEFLASLNGRPIFCVSANVDIEFDVSAGVDIAVICPPVSYQFWVGESLGYALLPVNMF